ncbi:hypothetical protein [Actinomadura sp. NPDC048394]|uniref:hypothetical protein n=1 Tax=Actinomadura sp. NPDC048394 TaxID=3158223 RepID=UPI0033C7C2E2
MSTMLAQPVPIIDVTMPEPFHSGWNKIDGVTVDDTRLTINPAAYFFRYENPSWLVCDWAGVEAELLPAVETPDATIEQIALEYVKAHGRITDDAAEVLQVAWKVNAWQFRDAHLNDRGLAALGVRSEHLRMLRECCTLMALNRVEKDGTITNVGPAWMFPIACKVVYGLDQEGSRLLDELYHGTWFDEARRVEAVKANAALGGKLVHGCQSQADMRGGCVVPFGADLAEFHRELAQFGDDWIERVESCGR